LNPNARFAPRQAAPASRLIKSPKLYWNETGLALHLAHPDGDAEIIGALFENLVFCDLRAWRDAGPPRAALSYRRSASGFEVDFVIECNKKLLGIEVKAAT
jgi:predicted AAA+ superfamily ATPase